MSTTMQSDFAVSRRSQPPEALAPQTIQWLAQLPGSVRPRRLPIEFVRIANAMAKLWPTPSACLDYLDSLVIDRRGDRRGFPFELALEISYLKNHYETQVHPTRQTVWDEIAGRQRAR